MVTEILDCDAKDLLVYTGHGDAMMIGVFNNGSHFYGNHKLLTMENFVTNGNGQNECVFRHICDEDKWHYVFIYVKNVPEETSWKICEVLFN